MNPKLECPNCRARFKLNQARKEILNEEESTSRKTVSWVYTFCPSCKKDFTVKGEKKFAIISLCYFFILMSFSTISGSIYPFILAIAPFLFQNRISEKFIKIGELASESVFSPEVEAQHEIIHKALLELNDLMVRLEHDITFKLDHWYDLNEAMLAYVTNFYNKQNIDQNSKCECVMGFLRDFKVCLHDTVKSEEQLNVTLELTKKLKTNKPMYGINP
jgi:hypothetical protein